MAGVWLRNIRVVESYVGFVLTQFRERLAQRGLSFEDYRLVVGQGAEGAVLGRPLFVSAAHLAPSLDPAWFSAYGVEGGAHTFSKGMPILFVDFFGTFASRNPINLTDYVAHLRRDFPEAGIIHEAAHWFFIPTEQALGLTTATERHDPARLRAAADQLTRGVPHPQFGTLRFPFDRLIPLITRDGDLAEVMEEYFELLPHALQNAVMTPDERAAFLDTLADRAIDDGDYVRSARLLAVATAENLSMFGYRLISDWNTLGADWAMEDVGQDPKAQTFGDFGTRRQFFQELVTAYRAAYEELVAQVASRRAGLEEPGAEDQRARELFPTAWWSGRVITEADIEAEWAVFTMLKPESFRLISHEDAARIVASANDVLHGTEALNEGRGVTVGAVLGARCTTAALTQMTYAQVAMALLTEAQGMGYEVAFRGAAIPMRAPARFYGPALGDRPGVLAMVVSYFTPLEGPPRLVVPMVLWRPAGDARTLLRDHVLGGWKGDQPGTLRYLLGVELVRGDAPNEQLAKNHVHVTDSPENMRREMRRMIPQEYLQPLWPTGMVPVLVQADSSHAELIREVLGNGYRVEDDPAAFVDDGTPRVVIVDSPAPALVGETRARWPAVKIVAFTGASISPPDGPGTPDATVGMPLDLEQLASTVDRLAAAAPPAAGLEDPAPSAQVVAQVMEMAQRAVRGTLQRAGTTGSYLVVLDKTVAERPEIVPLVAALRESHFFAPRLVVYEAAGLEAREALGTGT